MSAESHVKTASPYRRHLWVSAGVVLLIGLGAMALLSEQLAPEQPAEQRPLLGFTLLYGLSWAGYVMAFRLMPRPTGVEAATPAHPEPMKWILAVAVAGRLLFLGSALIQSDDCYRYVLDGQTLRAGINPYRYTPQELRSAPPPALVSEHPAAAREVIARVNNPDVPTIYPPLALALFATGTVLAPWQIEGQRWVMVLCDLAALALLLALLARLQRPRSWIVMYAWNPLVIKEVSNTAHADSLVSLWLVVLCALLMLQPRAGIVRGMFGAVVTGVALAATVLAKLYPVLLVPSCLAALRRPGRVFKIVVLLVVAAGTTAACYLPFLEVGRQQVTAGLRTYSDYWINNAGAFDILADLFEQPRDAAAWLIAGIALFSAVRLARSQRTPDDLLRSFQTTLLGWLLLTPACFPWYAVPLLALAVLRPRSWAVVLSGCLGLYYLLRYAEYQAWSAGADSAIRLLEHGGIWLWLAGGRLRQYYAMRTRAG